MATTFDLTIITPDETIFEGKIISLTVPSEEGYIGILAHHAPIIAQLGKGNIKFTDAWGNTKQLPSRHGLIEVRNNTATIIF